MKTRLTTEQSQHLISLGVPKEKARCELPIDDGVYVFSFTDLLEILPKEIIGGWGIPAKLSITVVKDLWYVCYNFIDGSSFDKEELIDALYQLACWYYGEYLKSEKK